MINYQSLHIIIINVNIINMLWEKYYAFPVTLFELRKQIVAVHTFPKGLCCGLCAALVKTSYRQPASMSKVRGYEPTELSSSQHEYCVRETRSTTPYMCICVSMMYMILCICVSERERKVDKP